MRIAEFPMIAEVREEYKELRQNGVGRTDSVNELLLRYRNEITLGAEDDAYLFWIGLADAQYSLKELSDEIAQKGILAIRQLEKVVGNLSPADIQRRINWYSSEPMPEQKNVKKTKKFRCEWKIGDTFAYQLSKPETDEMDLSGRYVILRKVDDIEFGDGRLLPVVTLTFWNDAQLPCNETAILKTIPMALANGRLCTTKKLFEYRAEILFRSKAQVEKLHLEYLGNFANIEMPKNEMVFTDPGLIMMISPDHMNRECYAFYKVNDYIRRNFC